MSLTAQLEIVDALPARQRGPAFENLIVHLFERAHFGVVPDAGAARPRQTDLIAWFGRDRYLVEAKHEARLAGVPAIAGVRDRLNRTDARVVGVVVSRKGFTRSAREEVEANRRQPVLLIGADDLESVLDDPDGLADELARQHNDLVAHGRLADPDPLGRFHPGHDAPTTEPRIELVDMEGKPQPWVTTSGGYRSTVHTLELEDIDWTPSPGVGVSLDLPIRVEHVTHLVKIVRSLSTSGWTSPAGAWSIDQSERGWHGLGAETFLQALAEWNMRYQGLEYVHHREIANYCDQRDGQSWSLNIDIKADSSRRVWGCSMSLLLPGIPVELEVVQSLLNRLGVAGRHRYFRPLTGPAVERASLIPGSQALAVAGYAVEHRGTEAWVCGIVVRNPLQSRPKRELPAELVEMDVLIVPLRSWHEWGDRPASYYLDWIEWTRGTDTLLLRGMADWRDPLVRSGSSSGPTASEV